MITPPSTYDYNMSTRQRDLKKRLDVPTYDPSRYEVKRFMVTARDGAHVPVSMIVRKGWKQDGTRPLLLYAYGSYGATTEAGFNSGVLSLVDRGFAYAIAHIRGGQEMGRAWYDEGKMMKKKNTFFDFIDVAQYLVDNKYTNKDKLIANGGSAGGLLMGAITNMRPDLFRAVVADVPFVDVINTMMDASIPLTAQEWQQWGDPHLADQYAYMRSYSPYDNVERKGVPVDTRHDFVERFAGRVLGAGEVGGEAARDEDGFESVAAQGQHGGRAWRFVGAVRRPQRKSSFARPSFLHRPLPPKTSSKNITLGVL